MEGTPIASGTYENLTGSGDLSIVSSQKIKNALTAFYSRAKVISLVGETHEMQLVNIFQPYIVAHLDYAGMLSKTGGIEPPAGFAETLILAALPTQDFRNVVAVKWDISTDIRNLLADLRDGGEVKRRVITEPIRKGLSDWRDAFDRGEQPPPFFLRIAGSDTAPDTWQMLQQEQLSALFDPETLFDLGFYYSELSGVGRKYLRYVAFVENDILPGLKDGSAGFYDEAGALRPRYAANMDRLGEFGEETDRLRRWADCLVYRIEAEKRFRELCNRNGYVLDGMTPANGGSDR
jgi:hypothetical protein